METAIMWGWILTASMAGSPPIIDPNYRTEAECKKVKAEFLLKFPTYDVACTPTWKPDKPARKHIARKRTYQRTARR